MTIRAAQTQGPSVALEVLEQFPGFTQEGFTPVDLTSRLQKVEIEEDLKKHGFITLTFENMDGGLLTVARFAAGVILGVTWGYRDTSATRRFVLTRLRGMSGAVGRSRTRPGVRGVARQGPVGGRSPGVSAARASPGLTIGGAGAVIWEGRSFVVLANRIPLPNMQWVNTSHSAIARQVARQVLGLPDAAMVVQDTPPEEHTQVRGNESAAAFLKRLARQHKFHFDIDANGLFWGPPEVTTRLPESLRLAEFDVLAWEIEGDLSLSTYGAVTIKGYDPRTRAVVAETSETVDRGSFAMYMADIALSTARNPYDLQGAAATALPIALVRRAAAETHVIPRVVTRRLRVAQERLLAQIRRRWKLTLHVVGNPRITVRRPLELDESFGPLLQGRWYCEHVQHLIEPGGVYTTKITARRAAATGAGAVQVRAAVAGPGESEVAPNTPPIYIADFLLPRDQSVFEYTTRTGRGR